MQLKFQHSIPFYMFVYNRQATGTVVYKQNVTCNQCLYHCMQYAYVSY